MSLVAKIRQITSALLPHAATAPAMMTPTDAPQSGASSSLRIPEGPEISILIRHQYACADGYTFIGVRTHMPVKDLHHAVAYLIHVRNELPVLGHDDGDLNETEVVELLCRFYPCTPWITHDPPGHDIEIELWGLWHSEWTTDVCTFPDVLHQVARPGVRRAITEMMMAGVRPQLSLSDVEVKAGKTVGEGAQRDFLFLTRILNGGYISHEEGHLCPFDEPYSGALPPVGHPEPDLIQLSPPIPPREETYPTRLVRPDNPEWDLRHLDDPQSWRVDHPSLSATLPGHGVAVPLEAGEEAVWVNVKEAPHPLFEVWLGLGREFSYLYAHHEGLEEDRSWLLRYPIEDVEPEFTRRAPPWFEEGGAGCYGMWSDDDLWREFLTREELLEGCFAQPGGYPNVLKRTLFIPGITVVAHVPGTGRALWSDGHLSEHLQGADSPLAVTPACLDVLGMIKPDQGEIARQGWLPVYAALRHWTYTPAPNVTPINQFPLMYMTWGELRLEWADHSETHPATHCWDDRGKDIYSLKASVEEARQWVET